MFFDKVDYRTANRIIRYGVVAWILLSVGFAIYYYFDRYGQTSSSVVDQDIQHITQAIEAKPGDVEARVAISAYLLEKNQFDEAIKQGETIIRAKPDHQGALFITGKAYLAKNNEEQAISYYTRLVELNTDNQYAALNRNLAIVHFDLGNIYLKRGQYEKAEEEFIGVLKINRTDADAYAALAQAQMAQEKYDDAIVALKNALRLDPEYAPFYKALKASYEQKGMPDHAAFAGAMLLYTQGKHLPAADELVKVTQSHPDFAEAFRGLGMSYEKAGKKTEAIEAYKRAFDLDPADRASKQGIGRLTEIITN